MSTNAPGAKNLRIGTKTPFRGPIRDATKGVDLIFLIAKGTASGPDGPPPAPCGEGRILVKHPDAVKQNHVDFPRFSAE
jgi:hypothetical protein